MRFIEALAAIPELFLLIALSAIFYPLNLPSSSVFLLIVVVLAVVGWGQRSADRARSNPLAPRARLRLRCEVLGREQRPHHPPPHAAAHLELRYRLHEPHYPGLHHRRVGLELFRPRHSAALDQLGAHAQHGATLCRRDRAHGPLVDFPAVACLSLSRCWPGTSWETDCATRLILRAVSEHFFTALSDVSPQQTVTRIESMYSTWRTTPNVDACAA